ncbi:MAG TPA: Ku protein, partial [Stellaceae bacterium]|nr:Ku protein [Stellaceae bacterium]
MPRASWSGFLRLSLVTCPVYLTPATTEAKRIRLNQLNSATGNRVSQRLFDSKTGDEVSRDQIVKGYEFDRDRYVTIDDDELKELQVESSKIIDLDRFVSRDEVDPLYLDTPYYVYPEGELAAETFRVIGEAMAHTNKVGLGRITMSGRERPVLVEPRGEGLLMSQLRSSDEVRPGEFAGRHEAEVDPDLVSLAETIIERKSGKFEPAAFHDRYQEALRALVDSKLKGEVTAASESIEEPPKVVNLMDALKRSLAEEDGAAGKAPRRAAARPAAKAAAPAIVSVPSNAAEPAARGRKTAAPNGQRSLLLPVQGGRDKAAASAEEEVTPAAAAKRRKRA